MKALEIIGDKMRNRPFTTALVLTPPPSASQRGHYLRYRAMEKERELPRSAGRSAYSDLHQFPPPHSPVVAVWRVLLPKCGYTATVNAQHNRIVLSNSTTLCLVIFIATLGAGCLRGSMQGIPEVREDGADTVGNHILEILRRLCVAEVQS